MFDVITLDKVTSTNDFLKQYKASQKVKDFTTVVAKEQTKGKGCYGNSWITQLGKNLTFSVYRYLDLSLEGGFYMTMAVSLAIYRVLDKFGIEKISIKWPNDLMIGNKKICGILIETIAEKNIIKEWTIGIGLNVNQDTFEGLEKATSLKKETHTEYNLQRLLNMILEELSSDDLIIYDNSKSLIKQVYQNHLYKKNKVHTFKDTQNRLFNGIIKGVSDKGLLQVMLEDDCIQEFDIKEIKF